MEHSVTRTVTASAVWNQPKRVSQVWRKIRRVGERAAQQGERVQSSWNHAPVFAAANGHIAKIFSVIQQVEKRRSGECSARKTALRGSFIRFGKPHQRCIRGERATLHVQCATAIDCRLCSARNRSRADNGELHVRRNGDCRGIAGVERMSVQFERDPAHHFRWGDGNAFRSIGKQCDRIVLQRRMTNRILHAHIGRVAHLSDRLRLICKRHHGKQHRSR